MSPKRSGKGSRGGFCGIITSGILLLLVFGAFLAIIRANGISTPEDLRLYFVAQGPRFEACVVNAVTPGTPEHNCGDWYYEAPSDGGSGGGFRPPNTDIDVPDAENPFDSGSINDDAFAVPYSVSEFGNGIIEGGIEGYENALDNDISIADPNIDVDYDRTEWRHWIGSPCNTRQDVLIKQGEDVETDSNCRIESGSWYDPFTGDTTNDSSSLDIDHIVPLNYAAQNGADDWDNSRREEFANDHINLRAVSASENRSKGADGPGDYMPPNEGHHCEYSIIWVDTVSKYDLSVSSADRRALERGLSTCQN